MLELKVLEQKIETVTPADYTRGTVGAKVKIMFDDFWGDYEKAIVFKRCYDTLSEPIKILVSTMSVTLDIPPEILAESGKYKIGAIGIKNGVVLPTLYSEEFNSLYATDTKGFKNADKYTPSELEQLRELKQDKLTAGDGIEIDKNNVISVTGGVGGSINADWQQSDETQPDYVKNRTHYSFKQFEDIAWNGDEAGHEVISPWDENERFIKMSDTVFGVENIIGGHLFLNDDTDFEITLDYIDNSFSGGFIVSGVLVVCSEELNAEFELPTGIFSKGVYFIALTGEPFVTKLVFPEVVKKLDKKYLPELEYSDLSNIPDMPKVDQTYTSTSENAQSGKAVAQAVSGFIPKKPLDNPGAPFNSVVAVDNSAFDDEYNPFIYRYINVEDEGVGLQAGWIVRRKFNGNLATGTPIDDIECANKKYVDDAITTIDISGNYVPTAESNGHTDQAYIVDSIGRQSTLEVEDNDLFELDISYGKIPRRQNNGNLLTNTPVDDLDCANKAYVDSLIAELRALIAELRALINEGAE